MKTLTELTGTLIRTAAAAIAEAKRSLPREEPPAAAEPAPAPEAPAPEAAAEAVAGAEAAPAAAPVQPEKAEKGAEPAAEIESEAVKAALDAAVEKATGITGDRLARLRDAVKVVGARNKDVRLVRVFGAEEVVSGAKKLGDFQYVVDFSPANMTQSFGGPKKERGGRGHGGGRGGGSGGGSKAGATGGFSMDSLREDRKGQRPSGGRPGGGRRPGGGGAPRGK
ncbi:MAG TPA: translation initiation factor 2 [Anaeromyxobacteraceae bacterium]|nr:translation initiation factor 2 [Anaeromyxobacteraceae bacterium]